MFLFSTMATLPVLQSYRKILHEWNVSLCRIYVLNFNILRPIAKMLWQITSFSRFLIVNFAKILTYFKYAYLQNFCHLFKEFICNKSILESELCRFCKAIIKKLPKQRTFLSWISRKLEQTLKNQVRSSATHRSNCYKLREFLRQTFGG